MHRFLDADILFKVRVKGEMELLEDINRLGSFYELFTVCCSYQNEVPISILT